VTEAIERTRSDQTRFDAVLLIAGHADERPAKLCARLTHVVQGAPIIILSHQASECDVVDGLEAGASDFVVAPYRPIELQARLRAQIRAHANSANVVLAIGPYRFHPAGRVLQDSHRGTIRLTQKETEVLKYLYRAGGRPVARQTLLREVWGYKHGADSYTVESHIYRLRRKIEADPTRPRFLLNEDGGYALIAMPARPWAPTGLPLAG
jgi:DNA-binding response OmpR family regulator